MVYKYSRLYYGIASDQRLFTMTACLDENNKNGKKLWVKVINSTESIDSLYFYKALGNFVATQ